jgi:hypothetical protein
MVTVWPSEIRRLARYVPTNPVPPVMKNFMSHASFLLQVTISVFNVQDNAAANMEEPQTHDSYISFSDLILTQTALYNHLFYAYT